MKKVFAILLLLIVLAVYALTTSPYLQAGDSSEMAAATISLGVPHQPSYPFYVFFTHYFIQLPLPYFPQYIHIKYLPQYTLSSNAQNELLIYRSGLASALFQALAAVFLYFSLLELAKKMKIEQSPAILFIAFAASLIYAFSQTIWLYASKPEVFALNNLFAVLILFLALRWWNGASTKVPAPFFLLYGFAFTHHQTTLLLLPVLFTVYIIKRAEMGEKPLSILGKWLEYPNDRKFNKAFPYLFCLIISTIPFCLIIFQIASAHPFINWGEVNNILDVLRALVRADYGTFSAYLTNLQNPTKPLDQLPFFFSHLVSDYSVLVIILAALSLLIIYKTYRNISLLIIVFFLFSGPLFLIYANFSLDSPFSQATVARFYMMPSLAIPIVTALAGFLLIQKINQIAASAQNDQIKYGKLILAIVVVGLIARNFTVNTPLHSNLTYHFIRTAINQTEDDAMIMVTGDITTMAMQYVQAVEGERKNRTIFSPGQLHLHWINEQLKNRYPELQIPPPEKGKQFTSPRQIIDANWGKHPIYISTEFLDIDKSIQDRYILWPKGFLLKVEEKNKSYPLEPYLAENNKMYESLDLSEFTKISSMNYQLETPLLGIYARHFYNLGAIFYTVHRYQDAIKQFNRSLTIDPQMPESYKALATLLYFTDDYNQRQPQVALNYLDKYVQYSQNMSYEEYQNTQAMIQKIINDAKAETDNQMKQQQEEQKKLEQEQKQAAFSAEASESATIPEQKKEEEQKQSDQ